MFDLFLPIYPTNGPTQFVPGFPAGDADFHHPFALTLFLLHLADKTSPATREFIEFAGSKEGQHLLAQAGYQPLTTGLAGSRR